MFRLLKADVQKRVSAISTDFSYAMKMETRADIVRRLADLIGPAARISDLSRLPALAANADEVAQAIELIRDEVVQWTSDLLIDELPAADLNTSQVTEREEDEWVKLRNSVAKRVLDELGIPRESSAGEAP